MFKIVIHSCIHFISFFLLAGSAYGLGETELKGNIQLDSSWEKQIYLSHIPTMDRLYTMSNEMIITSAVIDSIGDFKFDIDFLPKNDNLYRLHLSKVGDSPNSLIIGGSDQNFMFIVLNRDSSIHLEVPNSSPPFKFVSYHSSPINSRLFDISRRIFLNDSAASESDFLMSQFLDAKLNEELKTIADSSTNYLIALYALHHTNFETSNQQNQEMIEAFLERWDEVNSPYLSTFKKKAQPKSDGDQIIYVFVMVLGSFIIGYFLGKHKRGNRKSIQKLSVQERKIHELLKNGASNQEIAEHFNIGISTVKTHVSKILHKLNVKSRKDLMH